MKWKRYYMTKEEMQKYNDEIEKHKYVCKNCGRKAYIPRDKEKTICTWCYRYVFKNKKDEDLYRIKEKLKNE